MFLILLFSLNANMDCGVDRIGPARRINEVAPYVFYWERTEQRGCEECIMSAFSNGPQAVPTFWRTKHCCNIFTDECKHYRTLGPTGIRRSQIK